MMAHIIIFFFFVYFLFWQLIVMVVVLLDNFRLVYIFILFYFIQEQNHWKYAVTTASKKMFVSDCHWSLVFKNQYTFYLNKY